MRIEAASKGSLNESVSMRLLESVSSSHMRQPYCCSLNKVTLMTEPQLGSLNMTASTQEPQ